jgi:hypothetical protein
VALRAAVGVAMDRDSKVQTALLRDHARVWPLGLPVRSGKAIAGMGVRAIGRAASAVNGRSGRRCVKREEKRRLLV